MIKRTTYIVQTVSALGIHRTKIYAFKNMKHDRSHNVMQQLSMVDGICKKYVHKLYRIKRENKEYFRKCHVK